MHLDLDRLTGPVTLLEGTARASAPHFPANVNIAAALAAFKQLNSPVRYGT